MLRAGACVFSGCAGREIESFTRLKISRRIANKPGVFVRYRTPWHPLFFRIRPYELNVVSGQMSSVRPTSIME